MAMTETVLVTGGTGFVAGWCIVQLLERGYRVRTTVRDLAAEPRARAAIAAAIDPTDHLRFVAADLTADAGWQAAVDGCDAVLHVASPLGNDRVRDPDALIAPARDGTLRVLRAAVAAKVKRVVMTSSMAAATPASSEDGTSDETVWTDLKASQPDAYRQSKTIAERAAWDFMADHAGATTLATILPNAVFGPVLTTNNLGSVQVISRLLDGKLPGVPRLGFNVVDVRDVADLHLRAMTAPEAAGERFVASSDFMWMADIAATLRRELGDRARKVPTRRLPDFVLRFASLFDSSLRAVTPLLGRSRTSSSAKARRMLGWSPRPATQTVVDCAASLLDARK